MKKLILLVSLAVLAACSPKETVDEVFVQSTDIQLRIDGGLIGGAALKADDFIGIATSF